MSTSDARLRLSYQVAPSFDQALAQVRELPSVLGAAWHGHQTHGEADAQLIAVPMPPLGDQQGVLELWHAAGPFRSGRFGSLHYRCNEDFLFAQATIEETELDVGAAANRAYADLFALLREEQFPYLLRCWNYVAAINDNQRAGELDLERYRLFNIGRHAAFEAAQRSAADGAPAACALGTESGPLVMYCIAARRAATNIENPRQVSAYRYPQRYGPRSPTFSRASLLQTPGQKVLFISGTASIVGHESLHLGRVREQAEETLRNIAVLVEQANAQVGTSAFDVQRLQYKAFVRHADDKAAVMQVMRETVARAETIYLQADVCRAELLVEVEAVGFAN